MRARYPDKEGYVNRDGVKIYYELYENEGPTILLMATWSLVHSRHWKMQISYLARHFRVVTFDARGNGKSDRPTNPAAHRLDELLADALAVLDETKSDKVFVAGMSLGAYYALHLAARQPQRVRGLVLFGPTTQLAGVYPENVIPDRTVYAWDEEHDTTTGWAKENKYHWLRDFPDYVDFFMKQCISEPHSTKLIEDAIGWAMETDGELLVAVEEGGTDFVVDEEAVAAYQSITCPVLVIHGDDDHLVSAKAAAKLAELTGGQIVLVEGAGHFVHARDAVKANLLIKEFVDRVTGAPPPSHIWTRGMARRRRVLYISSPIGLGHARRDVAIAEELRQLHPDLEIDWLAQDPVTRVLEKAGERIHPASEHLANESSHIESEQGEHDLNCFQALRRMDEIILSNFMVFQEVVEEGLYDLVIGDEAWDIDYYWHENPELKRCANVWMTDFVGYLPMEEGRESFLTADYNAEMIEQVARFPSVRDKSIFVGNPEDIVPDSFGPDLPSIRDWTEDNFQFSGYVTGFVPPGPDEVSAMRSDLGYEAGEQVCVVTIGGSGVGRDLLERVIAAYPEAKRMLPALRMVVVAGPRIDPESLPSHEGLEIHGYVDRLYRHLSVCDLAVVQGGLTTTMELTAANKPFLYFPLRHHFEQNLHVRHRLDRYGAGIHMDYAASSPDAIAEAISSAIGADVQYQPVETDGAARAASMIAELV